MEIESIILMQPGDNRHRMPLALAHHLAEIRADEDHPLHTLFCFSSPDTARNFTAAHENRRARRGKDTKRTSSGGWGPRVAITSWEVGADIVRLTEIVTTFYRLELELGSFADEEERKSIERLILVTREYNALISAQTRNSFAPGDPAAYVHLTETVPERAQESVRQYYRSYMNAIVVRVPKAIAELAHTHAPAGLTLATEPADFWKDIAKADMSNDLDSTGPLVAFDLDDARELLAYALEQRRSNPLQSKDKDWAAWNSLIYRVKDELGEDLDEDTVKV